MASSSVDSSPAQAHNHGAGEFCDSFGASDTISLALRDCVMVARLILDQLV